MCRRGVRWLLALGLAIGGGCGASHGSAVTPGSDCVPKGATTTVRGVIRIQPFGKGRDGVVLEVEDGAPWIVEYEVTARYRELAERSVEVVGRACDRRGAAVLGRHLAIERATVTDAPAVRDVDERCYPYAARDGACLTRCDFYGTTGGCAQGSWPLRCNADGTCTPEHPPH